MIDLAARLQIESLGQRGEGVAEGPIYVPYALPGETVIAEIDGDRGHLVDVIVPSPDRVVSFCPYYTRCGGCAVQTLAPLPYAAWKRGLLVTALQKAGVRSEVAPLVDAHGEGRRRATFHARSDREGVHCGFMQARAHAVVDLENCPVLAQSMGAALPAARSLARRLATSGKPLDIQVTATQSGLDIDLRGHGPFAADLQQDLVRIALSLDLARLSNHGTLVLEQRSPVHAIGNALVVPPPGAFLQATLAGEETLAARVAGALKGARRVADLFSGIGTFSLRLGETATIHAYDSDEPALQAQSKAARATLSLHRVTVATRDLFRRPLTTAELDTFDAVVFDPPRAGAEAQARTLAASAVPRIVAVSCNAQSFARDAALLAEGGYAIDSITPIDQFRHSPHLEIVGIFSRQAAKSARRGRLFG